MTESLMAHTYDCFNRPKEGKEIMEQTK